MALVVFKDMQGKRESDEGTTTLTVATSSCTSEGNDSGSHTMSIEDEDIQETSNQKMAGCTSSEKSNANNALSKRREEFIENKVNKQCIRRKVSWGCIEMYMHPVIPGDHPDTLEGPPLTIDWECIGVHKINIDDYEAMRPARLKVLGQNLRLGWMDRLQILRQVGVRESEIAAATAAARSTRRQRQHTMEPWRLQLLEEIQEKVFRKIAKTIHPERRIKVITRY